MVSVTVSTATVRNKTELFSNDTTIKGVFDAMEIDYSRGTTCLDGAPLDAAQMNQTLKSFGISEDGKCRLNSIIKTDNA